MSQKIYRLAALKVTPATNRELDHSTYGIYALKIYSLKGRTMRNVALPEMRGDGDVLQPRTVFVADLGVERGRELFAD